MQNAMRSEIPQNLSVLCDIFATISRDIITQLSTANISYRCHLQHHIHNPPPSFEALKCPTYLDIKHSPSFSTCL